MDANTITILPEGQQQHTPYRESCTGKKCFLCTLTGYHSQTHEEKMTLFKQATIGILILIILLTIVSFAGFMVFRTIIR